MRIRLRLVSTALLCATLLIGSAACEDDPHDLDFTKPDGGGSGGSGGAGTSGSSGTSAGTGGTGGAGTGGAGQSGGGGQGGSTGADAGEDDAG